MNKELDEISLREIIEIIWNGKWMIAIITITAVLISGVATVVLSKPMYEARTTVILNNLVKDNTTQLSLEAYKEQVKNHGVMSSTIGRLNEQLNGITIAGLREKIETEIIKGTNLIRIYVTDENQELVAQIANAVTEEYINYINEQARLQMKTVLEYEIAQLEDSIIVTSANQRDIQKELNKTPQNLVTQKSLSEHPYLNSVVSELNDSKSNMGSIQFQDEELNPLYVSLQKSLADINIELSKLLNRKAALVEKLGGENLNVLENLIIASPAIQPEGPVGNNLKLILAVSTVMGLIISSLIVFIRHYWRVSADSSNSGRNSNVSL